MTDRKNLWLITQGQRLRYSGAIFAMAATNVFMFGAPLIGMYAIDVVNEGDLAAGLPVLASLTATLGESNSVMTYLWLSALASILITAIGGGFLYLRGRWAAIASEAIARRLRETLFRRLHHVMATFFDDADTGDLVQRCSSDVETVRVFLAAHIVEIGRAVLLVLTLMPVLFWRDTRLAWLSICLMPFLAIGAYIFFARVKHVFQITDESEGELTAVLQENLTGIRVVRAFAQQDHEIERFGAKNQAFRDNNYRLTRLMALYWGISDFFAMSQIGIVLVAGAMFVIDGSVTIGELFAFLTLVGMVIWPVRHLGRVLTDTGKAVVAIGRINHILTTIEESLEPTPGNGRADGDIRIDNVSFEYTPGKPVLKNVSVHIRPGETVGLVGAPGSGKTSLIRALLRLYPLSEGEIYLDGQVLTGVDRKWLRRQVGVVLQEPFLYSRSVEQNLRVGRPEARQDELLGATRDAAIHDSIMSFPDGYGAMVGERGVTLSGGQRQRVALARALLKDPPILVLDDALSAVDTGTEKTILDALQRRHGRHTTLVIAHRLTSVRNADRIMVLDHGRLVQIGSHDELSQEPGPYRRLCEIQGALDASIDADVKASGTT